MLLLLVLVGLRWFRPFGELQATATLAPLCLCGVERVVGWAIQ